MKFGNGQGYPVVYNADTSILLNGANPQLEGKITGATDSNGVLIADAQLERRHAELGGRRHLLSLPASRPDRAGSQDRVRRASLRRGTSSISYGLYVDDIDADVHALLLRLGAIGAGLMALMALAVLADRPRHPGRARPAEGSGCSASPTGSLDQAVEETERGDEIGRMAETLELLRQTAMTARTLEAEQVATKQRAENEKREALIALADRFDASVGRLVGLMASGSTELEATAQSMTGTAERTNQRASRRQLGGGGGQHPGSNGRRGGRRTDLLDRRNQPSGRAIRQYHQPRRRKRAPHRHHRARARPTAPSRSSTSQS